MCLYIMDLVLIHDLETGVQKAIEINGPRRCFASPYYIAVTTLFHGLHLYTTDGDLVHVVPDSLNAECVSLHPRNTNILVIGFKDGSVRFWDVSARAYVSSFKQHTEEVTGILFTPDFRLFLSSADNNASIVTLDAQFQILSSVKLRGHTNWVNDILPLPSSNMCVTCSYDKTIKVWDCETGACLRTLVEHTQAVNSLTMCPHAKHFASGSYDSSVIIWSCATFEVLRRMSFPSLVRSLQ